MTLARTLALTPSGHLFLAQTADAVTLPPGLLARLEPAFARGVGHGLLALGLREVGTALYFRWKPYVPVAARREKAAKTAAKLAKRGHALSPVTASRGAIAKSFWGKAWCENLERYSDYASLRLRIGSATIESDEEYVALADFLRQAKRRREAIEADRVKLKKPVLQLGKDIEEMFRAPLLVLHSAIDLGTQKLLAYDALKKAEADGEAALAAQAAPETQARGEAKKREPGEAAAGIRKAAAAAAVAPQFAAQSQVPVVLGHSQRRSRPMSWQWNVTDFTKIDRKWLTVNDKLVNKVVAQHKGEALNVLGEGFGVMYEYTFGLTPNR